MATKKQTIVENADPVLYTDAAGPYLNVHPRTLNNWVSKKKYIDILKPVYVGGRLGFRLSALEAFITGRTVTPENSAHK